MAWHDQDRAGCMSYDILCGAAKQNMLQPGGAMRGSNNHVRAVILRTRANLLTSMADPQRLLHLDSVPIRLLNKIAHLLLRRFLGLLHYAREIVSHVFVTRDVVLQGNRVEEDKC